MKKVLIVTALAFAVLTLNSFAQDGGGTPPPDGGQGGGPKPRGFHLLPPGAVEQLKLTDDQKQQVADLEAEVKAKIEKILTPEQLEQLKQMHPPQGRGQGGQGGPGAGMRGPGGQKAGKPSGPPPADDSNQ